MKDTTAQRKIYDIVNSDNPKSFTFNGNKAYISKDKINQIKNKSEGGILPLATLLPLLFAGLGAAGAVTGGVSTAIRNAKVEGSGIKDVIKEFVDKSGLENASKKALKNTLKNLSEAITIEKSGDGLFLGPYKK